MCMFAFRSLLHIKKAKENSICAKCTIADKILAQNVVVVKYFRQNVVAQSLGAKNLFVEYAVAQNIVAQIVNVGICKV